MLRAHELPKRINLALIAPWEYWTHLWITNLGDVFGLLHFLYRLW